MAKEKTGDDIAKVVQLLVEVGGVDTVYADVYLRRARELLGSVFPAEQFKALKGIQRTIDATIKESKAAALARDWQQAQTLAARVEALRQEAQDKGELRELAAKVYEPYGVSIDPFSPGFESLAGNTQDPAEMRNALVDKLKALAKADAPQATLYESRRAFFAGLGILPRRAALKTAAVTDSRELEQLAAQAAQQGDMARLRQYAQELSAR